MNINQLLLKAQMTLRKCRSSSAEVLKHIPGTLKEVEPAKDLCTPKGHPKALVVHWVASLDDSFFDSGGTTITKRSIASAVARVYDVLGWHAPAVLIVKILIRELWQIHLGWDDEVPESIAKEWNRWKNELTLLNNYPILRCQFNNSKEVHGWEVHGFSDASQKAYACSIYIRAVYSDASITTSLITAKTKVAPMRSVTIPKREFCVAHLLAQVLSHVCELLKLREDCVYAWSDSSVTLAWIQTPPQRLKSFVANRVAEIIQQLPPNRWRYVPTSSNTIEGMFPEELYMWNCGGKVLHGWCKLHISGQNHYQENYLQCLSFVPQS